MTTFTLEKPLFYHIGTGEKDMLYTLRLMWQGMLVGSDGFSIRAHKSFYIKNLGVNPAECVEKAKEFANERGIPFQLSHNNKLLKLTPITRESAKILSHEQTEKEFEEKLNQERINARHTELTEMVFSLSSLMVFGKHANKKTIGEVITSDPDYMHWLLVDSDIKLPHPAPLRSESQAQMNWIAANVTPPAPKYQNSQYLGELKAAVNDLKITVIDAWFEVKEVNYGITTRTDVYLAADESGNQILIKYSGNAWEMEIGGSYTVKGKIAYLGHYKGCKVTNLNYVKIVK